MSDEEYKAFQTRMPQVISGSDREVGIDPR